MSEVDDKLIAEIDSLSDDSKRKILAHIRKDLTIHRLEDEWQIRAEAVLEAISRAPDLTQRGVRGVLAESVFAMEVLPGSLPAGWSDTSPTSGDHPFDARIEKNGQVVRIQVKLQRRKSGQPMLGQHATKSMGFSANCYVVETQKTRAGEKDGESTRPYRFDEFDILAVSLAPSTGNWQDFRYTLTRWLVPEPSTPAQIYKYQPVCRTTNTDWTDSLGTALAWLQAGTKKTISKNQ